MHKNQSGTITFSTLYHPLDDWLENWLVPTPFIHLLVPDFWANKSIISQKANTLLSTSCTSFYHFELSSPLWNLFFFWEIRYQRILYPQGEESFKTQIIFFNIGFNFSLSWFSKIFTGSANEVSWNNFSVIERVNFGLI